MKARIEQLEALLKERTAQPSSSTVPAAATGKATETVLATTAVESGMLQTESASPLSHPA